MMTRHFTEPTTDHWQRIVAADAVERPEAPWQFGYPARLPDGRVLMLPIRQLANEPSHAVASLLVNHASLDVVDTLGAMLAQRLFAKAPDLVIGLPTLGLALAPVVARALGHARYVPMGYSRKFWYDEALSAPVHSITSPTPGKRIYLDPNLRPLLDGKRLVLVDDAISTGTTLLAAWDLIESLGGNVVACGVAMLQGRRWVGQLGAERAARVVGVFESPLLKAVPEGWVLRD
jgi:adenine/guanine phosphoribosyltransferase-like PRPP-binding protein